MFTSECFYKNSSWCFFIVLLILFFDIYSFFFTIEYCFLSFLKILSVMLILLMLIDSDLFFLNMLWLKICLFFMWSFCLFNAFVLLLFFSNVYCILNLYCFKNFNYLICFLFSCLIVMKCNRFLWFIRIVNFEIFFAYILQFSRAITMINSFLSWTL